MNSFARMVGWCRVPRPVSCVMPALVLVCGCGWLVVCCGCRSEAPISEFRQADTELSGGDNFAKALELLRQLDEFEPEQTITQITYHLNQWLGKQRNANVDWLRDPLLSDATLGDLRRLPSLSELERWDLSLHDVRYLRESRWLRDIADTSGGQLPPPELVDWLSAIGEKLGAEDAARLRQAAVLFDWTVRNIQLDAFVDTSQAPQVALPAAQAIPGPGYLFYPWQSLLFGHGDAWLRARIFLLLARQAGIDAVMLGTAAGAQADAKPWLVGVPIQNELYLFEPRLGLAVPGPGDAGIATLGDVTTAPQLLRALDVGETNRYPVAESDLQHLVALIDGSSEALSRRMRAIESALTGEHRMVLTVQPAALRRRLSDCGLADVRLWRIPLEAELFRAAFEEVRQRDSRIEGAYMRETAIFSGLSPLVQARQLQFRHQFEREEDKPGAMTKYLEARLSDRDLELVRVDSDFQKQMGLRRNPAEAEESWQARLGLAQELFRQGKQHASYWLGIVHYENGDYDSAVSWFERRTLGETPPSPWVPGARYNLGRCYEALGRYDTARATYLLDDSPQQHGSLLRARWLRLHRLPETPRGDGQPEAATSRQTPAP